MRKRICYLGDTCLMGAGSYLAGIMTHYGLPFHYVPSDEPPPATICSDPYSLYVLSDYPAARFGAEALAGVSRYVAQGSGLVMIGGWESYCGCGGDYHKSPLVEVLPVVMQQADDRRNFAQPCLVNKVADHPILDDLPWEKPPAIGGLNFIEPKPNAKTVLTAVPFSVRCASGQFQFARGEELPLLVVGQHGLGRTAALATDVAPHWVGGLVDWGDGRIVQDVVGGFAIEVGNWYAQFFRNLLAWAGQW